MVLGDWQMIGFILTFQREGSLFLLVTQYLSTNLLSAEFLRNQS